MELAFACIKMQNHTAWEQEQVNSEVSNINVSIWKFTKQDR